MGTARARPATKKTRKIKVVLSAAALTAAVGLGAAAVIFGPAAAINRAPAQSRAAEAPVPVRVAPVVFTPRQSVLALSGSVQARTLADLAFRVGGKVVDRPVEVGDHVRAGQVLARLDQADLELAFEAAQSALQSAIADAADARAAFSRIERLRNSPAFLASEYDSRLFAARMADARLLQASRQVALAKDQLSYGTLKADADGVITALPVQVGQVVAAGQTVASLAHTAETEVVVDVPENRLPQVRKAARVEISLWAAPELKFTGRVREIGAEADAASRTFAVKVTVLDPPPNLLDLGMTAMVRFVSPPRTPLAILPATAITDRNGAPAVWVFDPKARHATLQPVKIAGYGGDGTVVIASGVSPGEQVVTAGASELDPNMRLVAWAGATR
ncbi:MAG: efflux RND transporter periplasmic adaptor subunit [Acetobacteraceae bacterium]